MSDFFARSAARPQVEPDLARTLDFMATLFVVVLGVAALYVGREIFIPIAIAILLSFVLSPPILLLRRLGLGRTLSVAGVVVATLTMAFVVGAVLTRQAADLAADLPKYQTTVSAKVRNLRDAVADNAAFTKLASAIKGLGQASPHAPTQPSAADAPRDRRGTSLNGSAAAVNGEAAAPIPVEVHQPDKGPFDILQTIAGTALSPLETTFLVVVFVVFILLQREDLRNRFIRLVGSGDLQRTTLAMNDAAGRLSKFFLVQTLVNGSFGLVVGTGLFLIGVPSPILWGIVAFLMRFVPYIGSFISAGFPIIVASAVDPGWSMALQTLALFLSVETIVAYVVEPWLYGHHTGISPIAVVVSATFWTWLWGTIGLVLSTPLTVCLVVLGRHVDRLAFLDVIFGDAPPLTPVETFYERTLVGDSSEVAEQAEIFLKDHPLAAYYDEVALPALALAQADLRRGVLDETRQRRVKDTVDEVIEDLSDHAGAADAAPEDGREGLGSGPAPRVLAPGWNLETPVLCIAGRSALDEAAAALLAQLLEKNGVGARVEPAGALTAGRIARLSDARAQMACLSFFDADENSTSARIAIRRLRRRLPGVKILAGYWGIGAARAGELRAEMKPDFCATNFRDALTICLGEAQPPAEPALESASDLVPDPKPLMGAA
ncbi:AI-2E family transporter [Methylocapsa palsarum]|uniref:Predicted PurR-regulated permease PerM n=1 Tax=Methylocapsa palsarum TaxID=1612308 RepID=A0A1I3YUC6_9HYPH|nr:AI-2E family transporter [Methylocapsa palsarum]SFK34969.1 Predicted PurR-regulated permease PerM [Methylocapsa palsarum]